MDDNADTLARIAEVKAAIASLEGKTVTVDVGELWESAD